MSFRPEQLVVIAVLNNPLRYQSRQRLFEQFSERVRAAGASLITIEAAFWDRQFTTPAVCHSAIHVIQRDELWLKECLINRAAYELPTSAEYIAWVDADVEFTRPDWVTETIHQLQHFKVVQMFQTAVDLGPDGQALQTFNGFGYSYVTGLPPVYNGRDAYYGGAGQGGEFWHPGYAWAMNRETWNDLGGLLDTAILGAGDHHMALSLIGEGERSVPSGLHPNYGKDVMRWQERCDLHVRHDVGYVPGTLLHHWHGKKQDRRYVTRWEFLQKYQYDPEADIKRDAQGVYVFTHKGERMRNALRTYFRSRSENSVDLE